MLVIYSSYYLAINEVNKVRIGLPARDLLLHKKPSYNPPSSIRWVFSLGIQ